MAGTFSEMELKLATPAIAATVTVPERVDAPGFAPMASVTLAVAAVATAPSESFTCTTIAGVMLTPAAVLTGEVLKVSCVAGPGPATPVDVAFTKTAVATPAHVMRSCCAPAAGPVFHAKLACPCALALTAVAVSEPPPAVTVAVTPALGTALPAASATNTTIGASVVFAAAV